MVSRLLAATALSVSAVAVAGPFDVIYCATLLGCAQEGTQQKIHSASGRKNEAGAASIIQSSQQSNINEERVEIGRESVVVSAEQLKTSEQIFAEECADVIPIEEMVHAPELAMYGCTPSIEHLAEDQWLDDSEGLEQLSRSLDYANAIAIRGTAREKMFEEVYPEYAAFVSMTLKGESLVNLHKRWDAVHRETIENVIKNVADSGVGWTEGDSFGVQLTNGKILGERAARELHAQVRHAHAQMLRRLQKLRQLSTHLQAVHVSDVNNRRAMVSADWERINAKRN